MDAWTNSARPALIAVLAIPLLLASPVGAVDEEAPPEPDEAPAGLDASGPPTVSAERDGLRLDVWLDRTAIAVGDRLTGLVRVSNVGTASPLWAADTCLTGPAETRITLPRPDEVGRSWTGKAAAFKRKILAHELRPESLTDAATIDVEEVGCAGAWGPERFEPGSVAEKVLAWDAVDRPGRPIVPGEATVTATFETLRHAGKGRSRSRPAVTASMPVEIVGEQGPTVPLVRYVDAALADDAFREWVEAQRHRHTWRPSASYWPNSDGEYPAAPRYEAATDGAVDIGMFADTSRYGAVTIDMPTPAILGRALDD